jgi:hypothetical protein
VWFDFFLVPVHQYLLDLFLFETMIPTEDISTILSHTPGSAQPLDVSNNSAGMISAQPEDDGVAPAVKKV